MFESFAHSQEYFKKNGIRMIDFKMVDLLGRWRHLTIPVERWSEDILKNGIGFDGSNYGFAPIEKSDMVFIPVLSSATKETFVSIPTVSMIGDVMIIGSGNEDNMLFDQEPRNVVKNAEAYMKKLGIADEMIVGPEFEFYIFDNVRYTIESNHVSYAVDTPQGAWNSGNLVSNGYQVPPKGGYHIAPPHDTHYDFRSEVCMLLEERGVKIKYHHHEVGGPGQLEIETEFGTLSEMADKTMLIKHIIRNAAAARGKTATFMPKPIYGEAGSGMHVHMQLFKGGKPLFYDENGYSNLSETALYFIGGLLEHAASLCAFTNPSTNSFKRLVPGFEAPVTIGYATANRSAVIRIPAYAKTPEKKRFELRSPDGTCNPYYAFAAILMAGLDGIERKIDPSKSGYGPYDFNLYKLPDDEKAKIKSLPRTLEEALEACEKDHEYLLRGGVFPERLVELWLKKKKKEFKTISQVPTAPEFQFYYDL